MLRTIHGMTTRLANLVSRERVVVDGLRMDRTDPGNSVEHFFLADRRHPGTVGQGLLAKLFVDTINANADKLNRLLFSYMDYAAIGRRG